MNVVALVHHENGAYGISFPDFPGCTTVAHDLDGAVAKAAEVLAFHVEGLAEDGTLPRTRSMSELERDPAFREDAEGALLVLVPYNPPTRAVRINITVDELLLSRIDRAAEAEGETRSGYLAKAAVARMARWSPPKGQSFRVTPPRQKVAFIEQNP
jgi:predicted RNase H-like HicB family nuclease